LYAYANGTQAERLNDPNYQMALNAQRQSHYGFPFPEFSPTDDLNRPPLALSSNDPGLKYFDYRGNVGNYETGRKLATSFGTEVVLAKSGYSYTSYSITQPNAMNYSFNQENAFVGLYEGGALTTESKLILSMEGAAFKGIEGKVYGAATEGLTYVAGQNRIGNAKFDGNVSSSAQAFGEVSFKANANEQAAGVTLSADAALFRAQGKVSYPFQIGSLAIDSAFQGELQGLGVGATAGFNLTRNTSGGSVSATAGLTPLLFGAKGKFIFNWSWKN